MALTIRDLSEGTLFKFAPHQSYGQVASKCKGIVLKRGKHIDERDVEVLSPTDNVRVWGCFPDREVELVEQPELDIPISRSVYVYKTLSQIDVSERDAFLSLDEAVSNYVTEMSALEYDLISVTPFEREGIRNRHYAAVMMVRYEIV